MAKNFPIMAETDSKIQEAERAPNEFKLAQSKTCYNKMARVKERILKAAREKTKS